MSENILIIAAHPDDEVLGCGGTIARHVSEGDQVYILILAEGITSRDPVRGNSKQSNELKAIKNQAQEVAKLLGAVSVKLNNFPDNRMDSVDLLEVIKVIEDEIQLVKPNIVYAHYAGDLNVDHRVTAQAVITALRPSRESSVSAIYAFEILSSTEWTFGVTGPGFRPNHFVDITPYFEKKISAMNLYISEMESHPHPRSVEGIKTLAMRRGSQAGLEIAEGFELIRSVI